MPECVKQNGTTQATYVYLADGTKAEVYTGSNQSTGTGYTYLGSLRYTKTGTNRRLESTPFGAGRFVNNTGGMQPYYHITDHLGSIRVITDANGVVKEQNDYYPYGGRHTSGNIYALLPGNNHKFNGKEEQTTANIGYLDYGARMYDNVTGRWGTPDPLAEKYYSYSPYSYCGNNPVINIDPDGKAWDIFWDVGNVLYDTGAAIYQHVKGNHDQAKSYWKDAGYDLLAAAIPFVPAGATKAVKGAGKVINVVKGVDKVGDVGKAFNKAEDVVKIGEKTAGSSRAARREAMRDAGIPTSQQPVSQSKNASGREYTYNTPGPYGSTTKKSVQQQTLDRSHPGQKHWEAGKVKITRDGSPEYNKYNRPRLFNKSKVKINY